MIQAITRPDIQRRVDAARHQLPPGDKSLDVFSWQLDHHPGTSLEEIQSEATRRLDEGRAERRAGILLQVAGYTAMAVGWVALVAVPVPAMLTPVALGAATCVWGAVEQTCGKQQAEAEATFLADLDRFAGDPSRPSATGGS